MNTQACACSKKLFPGLSIRMDEQLKSHLINSYLNQQHSTTTHTAVPQGTLKTIELPDRAVLDEFKNQVRMWIDVDNNVRKLKQAARERNLIKKQLSEKILTFMAKYNIEDLNTKDGSRLRFKVTTVKEPLTANKIKERLQENLGQINNVEDLNKKVFATKKIEKVSLRRLKRNTLDV